MNQETSLDNPYVGPRTFSYEQRHLFFGREREARDLLGRVLSERLLLFYAQSGAGKSSLLRTRLIPQLQDEKGFVVLPVARVSGELPAGVEQVDNIFAFNLMLSIVEQTDPGLLTNVSIGDFLARLVRRTVVDHDGGERKCWSYEPAPATGAPGTRRYALFIDQFEEIITAHTDRWQERESFFQQLDAAMQADPNLWVVLTLREDYLAAFDPYAPQLTDRLRARFRMERMEKEAALDAIRKPAELGGRPFAPGAAEKLVDDLRQVRVQGQEADFPGQHVEPVQLQVVCYQLWKNLNWRAEGDEGNRESSITLDDLAEAGDVDQALTQFYEETLADALADPAAAKTNERQLRTWFDKELITETNTRGLVYQGVSETAGLPNGVVDALQRRFLVRAEARGGDTWIELVHDRFVEPIRASNAAWFPANLSPLQRQAALWNEQGRSSGLLLRDEALAEAEIWAAAQTEAFEPYEQDFLYACREARRQSEREQRQTKRIRVLAVVAGAVAIVALVAALAAILAFRDARQKEAEAQRQTRRAQAGELATQAVTAIQNGPGSSDLALLLARQAVTTTYELDGYVTDQALDALAEAMANASPWSPFLSDSSNDFQRISLADGGKRYVTERQDGSVQLWDAQTGDQVADLEANGGSFVLSEDGALVTSAFGPVKIWSTNDGALLGEIVSDFGDQVNGISSDGTTLLMTNYENGPATLWNIQDQSATWTKRNVRISAQYGDWVLYTSGLDRRTRLLNIRTNTEVITDEWPADRGPMVIGNIVSRWDRAGAMWRLANAQTGEIIRPFGDESAIRDLVISPDGEQMVVISQDDRATVLDGNSGDRLFEIAGDPVREVSLSNAGKYLVVTSPDGNVRLIHAIGGNEHWSLGKSAVSASSFDTDDTLLVSVSDDGVAHLIDLEGKREMFAFDQPNILNAIISADGKRVGLLDESGTFSVWSTDVAERLSSFPLPQDMESSWFSPDARYLLAHDIGLDQMRIWDSDTGQELFENQAIWNVDFSPDGQRAVVLANQWATGSVFDTASPATWLTPGKESEYSEVNYAANGETILTVDQDGHVVLWEGDTGKVVYSGSSLLDWPTLSPDGSIFVVGESDGLYHLRDAVSGRSLLTLGTVAENAPGIWISPDSTLLVVSDENGMGHLWDIVNRLERFPIGNEDHLNQVEFSPDGKSLGIVTEAGLVRVIDTISGLDILNPVQLASLPRYPTIGFSADSTLVAISDAGADSIWNLVERRKVLDGEIRLDSASQWSSADGRFVLFKSNDDSQYRVWDTQSGEERTPGTGPFEYLSFGEQAGLLFSFSEDSAESQLWDVVSGESWLPQEGPFAVLSNDNTIVVLVLSRQGHPIEVWDLVERKLRFTLPAGTGTVALNQDGTVMASYDTSEKLVAVRDGRNGQALHAIRVKEAPVYLEFSPGGRFLLAYAGSDWGIIDVEREAEVWHGDGDFEGFSPDERFVVYRDNQGYVDLSPTSVDHLLNMANERIRRDPPVLTPEERQQYGLEFAGSATDLTAK